MRPVRFVYSTWNSMHCRPIRFGRCYNAALSLHLPLSLSLFQYQWMSMDGTFRFLLLVTATVAIRITSVQRQTKWLTERDGTGRQPGDPVVASHPTTNVISCTLKTNRRSEMRLNMVEFAATLRMVWMESFWCENANEMVLTIESMR